MKKNQLFYMTTFLLISLLFSCDRSEDEGTGDIYQSWAVIDFMSVESVAYPKDNNFDPVIEFKSDGRYSLKLDRNSCSGSFNLKSETEISISTAGCTKMCCDSEFSKKFVALLPQIKSYSINGNKMKLIVQDWGWIELELNN